MTSSIAWFYIWFFRGTPVLVQLFVWFNLGLVFEYINLGPIYKDYWSSFMTPLLTALLGLGLNEAAYMAEICRAGLLSVDEGQTEASHALGMSHTKTLRRIVIPQAIAMEALEKVEKMEAEEQGMREDVAAGMSFDDAYKKWGRA